MKVHLAVEDALSEAVLRKLLHDTRCGYQVALCYPERTRQKVLPAQSGWGQLYGQRRVFAAVSARVPVILLVDLDDRKCAPSMLAKWKEGLPLTPNLLIRIAVREVESWLLADFGHLMEFLQVEHPGPAPVPDSLSDPKSEIILAAGQSRNSDIRRDMIPISSGKTGRGYTSTMKAFVRDFWSPRRAAKVSESLNRAWVALKSFRPV
jgi:hypothetical protein